MKFTDDELALIGKDIGGTFHHQEGNTLVFGSHTFPSYRITVDAEEARAAITTMKKRSHIEIDDEIPVVAQVFRLFSRDGTGACKRELWVRFDWTENGWVASFYKKFGKGDATAKSDPMTEIPATVADLAAEAFRRLGVLNASGKTGWEGLKFRPEPTTL